MDVIVQYILPVFYIILLAWLLQRIKAFQQNGFSSKFIVAFFIGKCLAGIAYDYISLKYIPKGGDIPLFYGDGLELYKLFIHSPPAAFQQLQQMFSIHDVDIMNSHSSFIRRVFDGIKLIYFLLDFLSFGNLYTDTILFNGLAVFSFLHGGIFLKNYFKSKVPFCWLFLMPSAFFYTSAIFKEGIVFILICFMLPLAQKIYQSVALKRVVVFSVFFVLLFFFKFFIAVTFLLAIVLWWLLLRFPYKKKIIFIGFLTLAISGFFLSGYINPKINFTQNIVNRQREFKELNAHSKIVIKELQPTFSSFLVELPFALNNVFFKPLPGEGGKFFYLSFTIEMLLFWFYIFFLWSCNKWRVNLSVNSLVWCLLVFSVANLLIIGYTISNVGAITRYRSIFLPFVGLFCWSIFDGNRTIPLIRKKNNV